MLLLPGRQIQRVLNREHEIAKQHLVNGHKDRALVALRQRRYQETLLSKTDAQLEQLEQLVRSSISYVSDQFTDPRILYRFRP